MQVFICLSCDDRGWEGSSTISTAVVQKLEVHGIDLFQLVCNDKYINVISPIYVLRDFSKKKEKCGFYDCGDW